jgi:hypothetical protein
MCLFLSFAFGLCANEWGYANANSDSIGRGFTHINSNGYACSKSYSITKQNARSADDYSSPNHCNLYPYL